MGLGLRTAPAPAAESECSQGAAAAALVPPTGGGSRRRTGGGRVAAGPRSAAEGPPRADIGRQHFLCQIADLSVQLLNRICAAVFCYNCYAKRQISSAGLNITVGLDDISLNFTYEL
ncbi:hypothetical protein NDU88_007671 [Pleurodeles waltl]|uniref:Uncharacterized protein n=1 Tax=Pleurodeles waltl TaxID=8319 RepID=A0AAV7NVL7_PLEWA|nr:hypothetical protein NDU88_007671 [Pleurodeles waltl]